MFNNDFKGGKKGNWDDKNSSWRRCTKCIRYELPRSVQTFVSHLTQHYKWLKWSNSCCLINVRREKMLFTIYKMIDKQVAWMLYIYWAYQYTFQNIHHWYCAHEKWEGHTLIQFKGSRVSSYYDTCMCKPWLQVVKHTYWGCHKVTTSAYICE